MDHQKLQYFTNAAYYHNFSKAAEISQVTQATISRQIQALEDEIGVSLFIRSKQGVELTQAGKYLFNTVSSFMEQHQEIITGCRKAADEDRFRIRLATGPYEHLLLQEPLAIFLSKHLNFEVTIMSYTYKILASRLFNHSVDFGFCTQDCSNACGGLISSTIYSKPWQVVAHKDHPFWKLPKQQQCTLQNQKIVTLYRNSYEPVETYCKKHYLQPAEFIETNFLQAQILMISIQSAIGIMPAFVKSVLPDDLRMEDVLIEPLCPDIVATYNPSVPYPGCAELLKVCKEYFNDKAF
jgi:LysR family hydrogen peroxide-inducible transcriptional activator